VGGRHGNTAKCKEDWEAEMEKALICFNPFHTCELHFLFSFYWAGPGLQIGWALIQSIYEGPLCSGPDLHAITRVHYLYSFYKYSNQVPWLCILCSLLSVTMALTRAMLAVAISFTLVAISTCQAPSPASSSSTLPPQMSPCQSPSPSPGPGPSSTSSPPSAFGPSPSSPPSSASHDSVPSSPSNAFLRGTTFLVLSIPFFAVAAMLHV